MTTRTYVELIGGTPRSEEIRSLCDDDLLGLSHLIDAVADALYAERLRRLSDEERKAI